MRPALISNLARHAPLALKGCGRLRALAPAHRALLGRTCHHLLTRLRRRRAYPVLPAATGSRPRLQAARRAPLAIRALPDRRAPQVLRQLRHFRARATCACQVCDTVSPPPPPVTACGSGNFCTAGATAPTPCPAGTWGGTPNLASATCSGLCPAGFYCPAGSTTSTGAGPCTAMYYCPAGSTSALGAYAASCKSTIGGHASAVTSNCDRW